MNSARTFCFAGGGSGGHLYPALAVAEEVVAADPSVRCVFWHSVRPIDAAIMERQRLAGAPVRALALPAQPPSPDPRGALRFVWGWIGTTRRVRELIAQERTSGPAHVVAMGGFVAAPAARAAARAGALAALVNLDAVPGKANRYVARLVQRAGGAVLDASGQRREGWVAIGPIVRRAALAPAPPEECRRRLGLDPARPTLLVVGGSQGAASLSAIVRGALAERITALDGWQVLHLTGGREGSGRAQGRHEVGGVRVVEMAYLEEMGLAWGAADAAVSRAGAGGVAEARANAVPCVFVPYPFHRDRHQAANARPVIAAGGGILFEQSGDPAADAARLRAVLGEMLGSDLDAMRRAIRGMGPADGARTAASILLESASNVR